jgi:hypothetical protein
MKMEKWQIEGEKKKDNIKIKVHNKAKLFQKHHALSDTNVNDFLNVFNAVINNVNLDQDKISAQAEMQRAKDICNKLINDFIESHWNNKNWRPRREND